jgi:2-polyprenyl-3-methyl-5-hydroxy-6-metoxy-1,4-benzoquinol methylase
MDDFTKYYKEFYKTHGETAYKMSTTGMTGRLVTLKEWVHNHTNLKGVLLDIGCGDGYLSTLVREDIDYTGIDINTSQVKAKAVEHDLMKPPFPFSANTFDTIVCSEVLEHLFDLRVVHKEARRLIKKGGTYIVSTPNFDWIDHHVLSFRQLLFDHTKPHLFEHIRQYNLEVHAKYLKEAGFVVQEIRGADAQYSQLLYTGLQVLHGILTQEKGLQLELGETDAIIGRMLARWSHTIMLRCSTV